MNALLPKNYCNLVFEKTINRWDEALPLGNGDIGCLIWGKPGALRLSIDKSDLWDCSGAPEIRGDFTYAALKKCVAENNQQKIHETFDYPYYKPTPTKLPAGKIIINLPAKGRVKSALDLATAGATVSVGEVRLQSFVHAGQNLGFVHINSDDCVFSIENPRYGKPAKLTRATKLKSCISMSLKNLHYPVAEKDECVLGDIGVQYFTQQVSESLTYGIFLGVRKSEGTTTAVYTVGTGNDANTITQNAVRLIEGAIAQGYAKSFEDHKAWWRKFWENSHLELEDKFFEKQWYLGNYLLGSCSRKGGYPMPLQGVWTADNGELPPWKGDYHHDLNTQLCYYSYLKANHTDEGASFTDYLLSLSPKAEEFARDFYAAKGLCLPSVMDIEGNALGGWSMYALAPTNQLWLCRAIEKHALYTGDEDFLRHKAYPYIKASGEFILSLLQEDDNGKLVLPLSSSPEIHDNSLKAWLTPNSNYDLALMRAHFASLVRLSKSLCLPADTDRWQGVFDRLDALHIDDDKVLLLSRDERLRESHRHIAHLMAIHPLRLIEYESEDNRAVIDACIKDLEALGTSMFCGYSFGWLAELYAVQRNGEKAHDTLEVFWRYFCSPNGFHLNGDYLDKGYSNFKYRPFTLEGNFCAVDALQEMLLYSEGERIVICPAIPASWQNLSFTLRAESGVLVSVTMKDGRLDRVRLEALCDTRVMLECPREEPLEIRLNKGEVYERQPRDKIS